MPGILEFSWNWDFVVRFLSIALIDLALSGDNAIVIGMAAAALPRRRRKWAIVFGGGLAIAMRITLTTIATLLLRITLLSAIGGCALFWVAWRLLRLDVDEKKEESDKARQASTLRQAIILIVTADFMMSLDNVIAVAGCAQGHIFLLILGLLMSMPLLMTTGGVISLLIDKFRWLVFLGAAIIMFTGTRMVFEDKFVSAHIHMSSVFVLAMSAGFSVAVTCLFVYINRRIARAQSVATAGEKKNNMTADPDAELGKGK
jgi:YjbE family integral membrane protein